MIYLSTLLVSYRRVRFSPPSFLSPADLLMKFWCYYSGKQSFLSSVSSTVVNEIDSRNSGSLEEVQCLYLVVSG